jgi:putative transposase
MTLPRRHISGQVVMMTRRCTDGQHLLRPDPFINQVLAFEMGRAILRSGVSVHAHMAMSNHAHTGVTDVVARRSEFMQSFSKETSSRRNRHLDRQGPLWQPNHKFNDVVLLDAQSIEDQLLYIWLNPVKDGLVRRVEDWPGFKILPRHWGKPMTVKAPDKTYGRGSPKSVTFTPAPPPVPLGMTLEQKRTYYEEKIRDLEATYARDRARKKKRVLGASRVLSMSPFKKARKKLPRCSSGPFFATQDQELWKQAMTRYRDFLNHYDRARRKLLAGKKVTFPAGTLKLAREVPISCRARPDDEPGIFELDSG